MRSVLVELTEAEITEAERIAATAGCNLYPNTERGYQIARVWIAKAKAAAKAMGLEYQGMDYKSAKQRGAGGVSCNALMK